MNKWIDEWMNEWIDEWMYEWQKQGILMKEEKKRKKRRATMKKEQYQRNKDRNKETKSKISLLTEHSAVIHQTDMRELPNDTKLNHQVSTETGAART